MNPLKKDNLKVCAVIPARGGSKRFPRKNLSLFNGVPLIAWVADECRRSRYTPRIVISTEDEEIKKVCFERGLQVIDRPAELAGDQTPKQEVIVHAAQRLMDEGYEPDIVVSLQPNTPEFTAADLDQAMAFFIDQVFPGQPVKEVFTVNHDMIQNGAFRIMTLKTVFQKTLSTYVGVYVCDYIDIHYPEDLKQAEKRTLMRKERNSP